MTTEPREGRCPYCDAKMVQYPHFLNRALCLSLRRLHARGGGPLNLVELGLTRNQWDNFQKLRYFDLVARYRDAEGNRLKGVWIETEKGAGFAAGERMCNNKVWTYRGDRIYYAGHPLFIHEIVATRYLQREDYSATAVPYTE